MDLALAIGLGDPFTISDRQKLSLSDLSSRMLSTFACGLACHYRERGLIPSDFFNSDGVFPNEQLRSDEAQTIPRADKEKENVSKEKENVRFSAGDNCASMFNWV